MSALSNDDRGPATAADFREMAERLDVIADDIVILTRERDEAQATVARVAVLVDDGRHFVSVDVLRAALAVLDGVVNS